MLNLSFNRLVNSLRDVSDEEIIRGITSIACAIKRAMSSHPLEAFELEHRLEVAQNMLVQCMHSHSMENRENLIRVLRVGKINNMGEGTSSHGSIRGLGASKEVAEAMLFFEGPLQQCLDNELEVLLGTTQVCVNDMCVCVGRMREE